MDPSLNSAHKCCCIHVRTCTLVCLALDATLTVLQAYGLAAMTLNLVNWLWAHVTCNTIAMVLCIVAIIKVQKQAMALCFILNVTDGVFAIVNFILGCLYLTVLSAQTIAECRMNLALDECNRQVFLLGASLFSYGITMFLSRVCFAYKSYRCYKFLDDLQTWRATTLPPAEVSVIAPRSPDSLAARSPIPASEGIIEHFDAHTKKHPATQAPNFVLDSASSASDVGEAARKKSFKLLNMSSGKKEINLEPLQRFPTTKLKTSK